MRRLTCATCANDSHTACRANGWDHVRLWGFGVVFAALHPDVFFARMVEDGLGCMGGVTGVRVVSGGVRMIRMDFPV